jgi:hypothetical protein
MANGEIVEMGTRSRKTSSGYDLIHLMVGSEGTLGIVVKATVRLTGLPPELSAAVVTFPSVEAAGKAVFEIKRSGLNPAALELLGPEAVALMNRENISGLRITKKAVSVTWTPTTFYVQHGFAPQAQIEIENISGELSQSGTKRCPFAWIFPLFDAVHQSPAQCFVSTEPGGFFLQLFPPGFAQFGIVDQLSNVAIAQQMHQFVLGSNIRSGFASRPFPQGSFVYHENGSGGSQAHIANCENRYGCAGNDAGGVGRNFKTFSPGPLDLIRQGQAGESIPAG